MQKCPLAGESTHAAPERSNLMQGLSLCICKLGIHGVASGTRLLVLPKIGAELPVSKLSKCTVAVYGTQMQPKWSRCVQGIIGVS